MPRLRFTPTARIDLQEIADFIAEDNAGSAGRVLAGLRRSCRRLASLPGMGRLRPDIGPKVQSFPAGSYVIFFRRRSDSVEILAVLHGARDIERVMGDRVDSREPEQDS
jgi:toxin ParE1/3/4